MKTKKTEERQGEQREVQGRGEEIGEERREGRERKGKGKEKERGKKAAMKHISIHPYTIHPEVVVAAAGMGIGRWGIHYLTY